MGANPIDFDVSFGGLDAAAAQWRAYQTSLESVIQASSQLGVSQQNIGRDIQATQQALASTSQALSAYSQAVLGAANSQTQLSTSAEETISIFAGAGTSAQSATAQMEQFSGSMANLGKFVGPTNQGLDESNILMENLAGASQTTGQKIQQLGQGFGVAASSITGLVFSAHALNRAQFTLHQTETRLESARNRLEDQTKNLGKATKQYGADSEQVAAILADIQIQTERVSNFEERASLVQESYNMTLVSFATTTGPLVISTVSSISQGITSMGEVLKISRTSAISFITAWGPWIAAGGAIVAIGLSVVDTLNQVTAAETQRRQAMAAKDPFGQLNAELKELQAFDTNPLFKIGEAIRKGILPQGAAESKEFHLELDLRKWQSDVTQQIDTFVTSPDFKAAFESLPPTIQKTLEGELNSIVGIPFNPVNYLNPDTGEVDPKFMSKSSELLDKALADLAKHVQEKMAEFKRITLSGTAEERAGIMGLPTPAEFKEATALYKGNMQSVLVLLKDFNTKRLADARLSWDQYIAQTDVPQWFADLAKNIGNVDASFSGQGIQGSKQFFETLRGGFQEVTDEENRMLPKSQEVVAQLGLLKGVMDDAGISADGTASKYDNYVKAVEDAIQGHEDQIAIAKAVNDAMRAEVETWAGPLPEGMKFTTDTLQKANDTFKETGSVTEGVNVLLAENKAEFDNLRQSLGDVDKQITDVISATDLLGTAEETANEGLAKWFDGITKSIAVQDAERESLLGMAQQFGIDLPAGIQLTNEQLKALIEAYRRTGSEAGAMAEIHAAVFADMHNRITEVIDAFTEGGKNMKEAWKGIQDAIPKGQKGFMKDLFGDAGDMRENTQALADTAAAMDFLLDTTQGRLDSNQIEDWSKKFSKGLDNLRDSAQDMPFVDDQLIGLIDTAEQIAKTADNAADFRVLNGFINDLNAAIKKGDPKAIEELKNKWGPLLDSFAKGEDIDFNAISGGIEGLTASTQTLLDLFGHMPDTKELDNFTNAIGDILGIKGEDGKELTPIVIPAPVRADDFDTVLASAASAVDTLGRGGGSGGGAAEDKKGAGSFTATVIPAPDTKDFIAGMNDVSTITLAFISGFNNLMGGGGGGGTGGKKKKKGSGLTISAPNIDPFITGMDTASAVALGFIETFNNAMGGGGGGKKKKKGGGGLVIPPPVMDGFIEGLNTASEDAATFIADFTTGMEDITSAASSASGDVTASFNDIQTAAEDASGAVNQLQNDIDNLHGKTIEVKVNISGAGVKYLATGYHGVINEPTILVVGEAGPERVDVSASNQAPTGLLSDRSININPIFTQSAGDLKRKLGKGIPDLIADMTPERGEGRQLAERIIRHLHIPIRVDLDRKTLLNIIREHLLDD